MEIRKKTWPELFQKIKDGEKKFDVRIGDFECNKGDILVLDEWDPATKQYTGREIRKKIGYIFKTKGLEFWEKEEIEKFGFYVMELED